jgi:hypothetical protein
MDESMSEIQDEAYSEAMDEIERLEQFNDALIADKNRITEVAKEEIRRLKVFESRYREEYEIVKRIWEMLGFDEYNSKGAPSKSIYEYIQDHKDLHTRAADALESNQIATSRSCEVFTLIDELRKAAE